MPRRARWAAMAAVSLVTAACAAMPGGRGADATGAVDHVGDVLTAAGHEAPRITGLVGHDCGPADEPYGIRATDDPVTIDVAWAEVAPVVEVRGHPLPAPSEDPAAGAPAHVDRYEVDGDGWQVRWGSSHAAATAGGPATVVTVVGGGAVTGEDLARWEADGLVADVFPCG